jgi:RimJ/RimL family protein N-acetyltransferase
MTATYETERLVIRSFSFDDASFIVQLLNEKSFIRCIGDKKVRTIADAINYLAEGPISSYQTHGFGLNLVQLKQTGTPIGMCGLIKRDVLDYPDLGYAFLPEFWGKGYAKEACDCILNIDAVNSCLKTILAITLPDNLSSNDLLKKVGFTLKGTMDFCGSQNNLYEYVLFKS